MDTNAKLRIALADSLVESAKTIKSATSTISSDDATLSDEAKEANRTIAQRSIAEIRRTLDDLERLI
jgi:hypothetical protein